MVLLTHFYLMITFKLNLMILLLWICLVYFLSKLISCIICCVQLLPTTIQILHTVWCANLIINTWSSIYCFSTLAHSTVSKLVRKLANLGNHLNSLIVLFFPLLNVVNWLSFLQSFQYHLIFLCYFLKFTFPNFSIQRFF
jgi:hypothetical protein